MSYRPPLYYVMCDYWKKWDLNTRERQFKRGSFKKSKKRDAFIENINNCKVTLGQLKGAVWGIRSADPCFEQYAMVCLSMFFFENVYCAKFVVYKLYTYINYRNMKHQI